MPYIKKEIRKKIDIPLAKLEQAIRDLYPENSVQDTDGIVNYCIFKLCKNIYGRGGTSYYLYNRMMGVLESCKQELYRQLVAPYEDKKIIENGDTG